MHFVINKDALVTSRFDVKTIGVQAVSARPSGLGFEHFACETVSADVVDELLPLSRVRYNPTIRAITSSVVWPSHFLVLHPCLVPDFYGLYTIEFTIFAVVYVIYFAGLDFGAPFNVCAILVT